MSIIVRKNFIGQPFDFEFSLQEANKIINFYFYLLYPDGTEEIKTGTKIIKNSTAIFRFVSEGEDLSQIGSYKLQIYIETSSFQGRRETMVFNVKEDYSQ